MRGLILGLLLGCGGAPGGNAGKGEAKGDTGVETDADADADADTGTKEELDPRCTVVLPANTWVAEDWGDATIRSNHAVWVCDSGASAIMGGDNNVMVLSGDAEGSLQGNNNTIYAVGSEGYYYFVNGGGNTLVTDGEPDGYGEDSRVVCPRIEIDFSLVPAPCPEAVE